MTTRWFPANAVSVPTTPILQVTLLLLVLRSTLVHTAQPTRVIKFVAASRQQQLYCACVAVHGRRSDRDPL